jgi:hypothetical protein
MHLPDIDFVWSVKNIEKLVFQISFWDQITPAERDILLND